MNAAPAPQPESRVMKGMDFPTAAEVAHLALGNTENVSLVSVTVAVNWRLPDGMTVRSTRRWGEDQYIEDEIVRRVHAVIGDAVERMHYKEATE